MTASRGAKVRMRKKCADHQPTSLFQIEAARRADTGQEIGDEHAETCDDDQEIEEETISINSGMPGTRTCEPRKIPFSSTSSPRIWLIAS